jgi:hypothetical protein
MPLPTLTTNVSRPRLGLCELLAACPTFRTAVGAADSAEAAEHIYSPYADDTLVDSGSDDAAGAPLMALTNPRPRAIVNHAGMSRGKQGSAYGAGRGQLILDLEFLPDPAETDPNVRLAAFEQQFGQIMDEIENREARDKGADEGIYTGQGVTFLNVTGWELVAGPGEAVAKEEQGQVVMVVTLMLDFIG